jgi:ribosomal protein L12E/L44/L45/RPP1/RPP2
VFNEQSKERIKQLCESVTKEQDQRRFSMLIAELDQLLEELQASPSRHPESAPVPSLPTPKEPLPDPEG